MLALTAAGLLARHIAAAPRKIHYHRTDPFVLRDEIVFASLERGFGIHTGDTTEFFYENHDIRVVDPVIRYEDANGNPARDGTRIGYFISVDHSRNQHAGPIVRLPLDGACQTPRIAHEGEFIHLNLTGDGRHFIKRRQDNSWYLNDMLLMENDNGKTKPLWARDVEVTISESINDLLVYMVSKGNIYSAKFGRQDSSGILLGDRKLVLDRHVDEVHEVEHLGGVLVALIGVDQYADIYCMSPNGENVHRITHDMGRRNIFPALRHSLEAAIINGQPTALVSQGRDRSFRRLWLEQYALPRTAHK